MEWSVHAGMDVNEGDRAPDFTLLSTQGPFTLSAELEKGPVVLYFYPRDFTSGCTAEACAFRDTLEEFEDMGVKVAGVSSDGVDRHFQFAARNKVRFPLLSDPDNSVRKLYGVKPNLGFIPGRTTFVISPDGVVLRRFTSQINPRQHVAEALAALGDKKSG